MKKASFGVAIMAGILLVSTTAFAGDIIKDKAATVKTTVPTNVANINKVTVKGDIDQKIETALTNELKKNFDKAGIMLNVTATWSGVGANRALVLLTNYKNETIEKTATLKGIKPASDVDGAQLLATDAARQLVTEYLAKSGANKKVALRDPKMIATPPPTKQ